MVRNFGEEISDSQLEFKMNSTKHDFMSLFIANQRKIYTFILMYVPSRVDADDIMQETATWMWENFEKYEPGTNFGAWAVQIARYKILNMNRMSHKKQIKFGNDIIDLIDASASGVIKNDDERIDTLRHCLTKLPKQDQLLIHLRYEKGHHIQEMSQKLKRPPAGLYKALAQIHDILLRCVRRHMVMEGE